MPDRPDLSLAAPLAEATALAGDAVIVLDPSGRVVGWEGAAEPMLGRRREEALGRPGADLVAPPGDDRFRQCVDRAAAGSPVTRVRGELRHADGRPVPAVLWAGPWRDSSGGAAGVVVTARDPGPEEAAIERAGAVVAELDQLRARVRDADDRSKRFLEHAAHQLRTPMACISACVDSMQWGACPDDGMITDLARETARATRLVQSLLRMARLDEGLVVEPAACDLVELLSEECERIHGLAPALDIDVRIRFESEDEVRVDGHAVREILANLLDNARRHAARAITIGAEHRPGALSFRVADDGPGLDPDGAERVFERFVSLDGRGGSGLGLPIARAVARAHGGDLAYEPGAFTFWVATGPGPGDERGGDAPVPAGRTTAS